MKTRTCLCYRCEHRARGFETGHYPRCECRDLDRAVSGCYMYMPSALISLTRDNGDCRPVAMGALGARMHAAAIEPSTVVLTSSRKPHQKRKWILSRRPENDTDSV